MKIKDEKELEDNNLISYRCPDCDAPIKKPPCVCEYCGTRIDKSKKVSKVKEDKYEEEDKREEVRALGVRITKKNLLIFLGISIIICITLIITGEFVSAIYHKENNGKVVSLLFLVITSEISNKNILMIGFFDYVEAIESNNPGNIIFIMAGIPAIAILVFGACIYNKEYYRKGRPLKISPRYIDSLDVKFKIGHCANCGRSLSGEKNTFKCAHCRYSVFNCLNCGRALSSSERYRGVCNACMDKHSRLKDILNKN